MQQFLCCPFYRLLLEAFHLHLHVRLARAYPYLANHDVVQLNIVSVFEANEIRTACFGCLYLDAKVSILVNKNTK